MLGAGPAGLVTAWRLAEAGHQVTVLEAADQVGGMSASIEVGGQRVDLGSHRLHPATPGPILDLVGDLLGTDLQVRPRNGRLRLGDRWVGFPLRVGDLARSLPPMLTARLATDAITTTLAGLAPERAADSFASETNARFGPTIATDFYGRYARKLYGLEPDELDVELAERRVSASSPIDIARRLVRAGRPAGRTFLYPRRGYGQIVDRLAEAAVDAGADIRTGTPVESIAQTENAVALTTRHGQLSADVVPASLPRTTLARLLTPAPSERIMAAVDRQRVRSMLLVYLVLDQPQYTPFDAHYIPNDDVHVARLSEPKNYRTGDDPADRTVLCAEIACWPDDDLVSWSPDRLGAMVAGELGRVGLPAPTPAWTETRFLPSVYPVFDRAGRADRATLDRWGANLGRVLPMGRQGLGVIDNLHHVLTMGLAAADVIGADGSVNETRWRQHLNQFADHTVED